MISKFVRFCLLFTMFCVLHTNVFAAGVTYEFGDNGVKFTVKFDRAYSNVEVIKGQEEVIVAFDASESVNFTRQDFFDSTVKSVWLTSEGAKQQLHFTFDDVIIEPIVATPEKTVEVEFTFPLVPSQTIPMGSSITGAYIKMVLGLFVIFILIVALYLFMRHITKNSVITDIPGVGRLLGRADIGMKKSLVFYELGEIIYLLGVTENEISLVDKIVDTVDVNLIKAGFTKRKNFDSYLKFFTKKGEVKEDLKNSKDLLEEKLSTLRKKR